MKRPLGLVALCYFAGILMAPVPIPLPWLLGAALVIGALALFWSRARPWLLGPLIILAGWSNAASRAAIISPYDVRTIVGATSDTATVRGVLCETPRKRILDRGERIVEETTARLELSAIHFDGADWQPAIGRVAITARGLLPDTFFGGQTVEITGEIHPPSGPVAEGLFDYRAYLRSRGIYYEFAAPAESGWRIVSSPSAPPLADRFSRWARNALAIGLPRADDEALQLEWALTLGWKNALTEQTSEPFLRASTYHIFAVDGLRIAIITGIFIGLFRTARIPRAVCGILAIPLILAYAALTGWPASAVRAIVMIAVIFGGWALKRPSDPMNSLFAAALIILVWDPRQLYEAGFQFSFIVVFCIILTVPRMLKIGDRALRPNPLVPLSLQPRWKTAAAIPARYVANLFIVSLAAWLGSIPLAAYYFNILTPISSPANVLAVPMCGLVLSANCASLLLAAWFPWLAGVFNCAGWALMKGIMFISQWFSNWPEAYAYISAPSMFTIAVYYAVLLALLTGWLFKENRWRKWPGISLTSLTCVWFCVWFWQRPATHLTVLPLQAGHATFIDAPGPRNTVLIDCGNQDTADMTLKPFLRAHGVNRLGALIVTHGEAPYSDGAELISEVFEPVEIFHGPGASRSAGYRRWLNDPQHGAETLKTIQRGGDAGGWEVLHPAGGDQFAKGTDNAIVLRGHVGAARVLLLPDLGRLGQSALLERESDLRADILVAGVPPSGELYSATLFDAVDPRVIVIADSAHPAQKTANATLRDFLGARKVPVIYLSKSGAVTLDARGSHWTLRAMDGTRISSEGKIN